MFSFNSKQKKVSVKIINFFSPTPIKFFDSRFSAFAQRKKILSSFCTFLRINFDEKEIKTIFTFSAAIVLYDAIGSVIS
jgi:hypothetical protein